MVPDAFWPVLLGVLGAVFGSFIATLAIRWPRARSVAGASRSACDSCGRPLRPHELVPILSFAMLRGRCSACGAAIPLSHVVTELLGAGIGIACGLVAPGVEGVAGAVFGWLLLSLAALDLAAFWLPNILNAALAATGLMVGLAGIGVPLTDRLIGGVAGYATLMAVAAGYRGLRGREGLGGGDPKLFGAIGMWLGWQALPLVLLVACMIGFGVIAALRLGGKPMGMQDRLPLGVMLAAAAWMTWLGQIWEGMG